MITSRPMKLFLPVFVVAFAILSWNLWNVGIASGSIDPVMHWARRTKPPIRARRSPWRATAAG